MRGVLLGVFATLACGTAAAQRVSKVDGAKLMAVCTGKQVTGCDAYLDGFTDAIEEGGRAHALACVPKAATGTELRDVVVTWLKANPQAQHDNAATVARTALAKAYPCHS
jgi:hypothetical protein